MQVEGAVAWHAPYYFRKHPEAHDDEQVGLPGGEVPEEGLVFEFLRLEDGKALFHSVFLDGRFGHLESPSGGFVGYGDDAHDLVAAFYQGIQRAHGEFRRAHIDDACISEHTDEFTLEFAEPGLETVDIQQAGILYGLDGEEGADWRQHKGRYEFAHEGCGGPVRGQSLAGDVDDPVEHEEQQ